MTSYVTIQLPNTFFIPVSKNLNTFRRIGIQLGSELLLFFFFNASYPLKGFQDHKHWTNGGNVINNKRTITHVINPLLLHHHLSGDPHQSLFNWLQWWYAHIPMWMLQLIIGLSGFVPYRGMAPEWLGLYQGSNCSFGVFFYHISSLC